MSRPCTILSSSSMAALSYSTTDFKTAFSRILKEKYCPEHLRVLKLFTTNLRDIEYRPNVEEEALAGLYQVLCRLSDDFSTAGDQELQLQLMAECFRASRTACVQLRRNQTLIRNLGFLDITIKLLPCLQATNLDDRLEALRCGIQFLGNLAAGNQMCKDEIWKQTFPDLFLQLLSVKDDKAIGYTAMVLHTCLDEAKVEELSVPHNILVAFRVMELCRTQPDMDWTVLIATQHFLKSSALVKSMYCGMSNHDRVTLLELLSAQLNEEGSGNCGVPPTVAHFLAGSFQKGCGAVLTLATSSISSDEVLQEALTVISLLDVLCEMTSDLGQFMFLQDFPKLLETTVELLEQVHVIGKTSKNVFSAAQNFSTEGDSSVHSPVVSFKAHLIRLIGNLCHGNTVNQNKVRDLEGIPLILDNCNIDSNNPFISQWAIFAIRNLLQHNTRNQELVAGLERHRTTDYSALRELGFEVEERNGSLLLKPLRKDS